jgi:hypothetical protein
MACSRGKAAPDSHTKLHLFADAAGHCQNPDCNQPLFIDAGRKNIHIAEMAHLFAAADDGPRANTELTEAERGHYDNLILLCPTCHTIIDKAPDEYPDAMILRWKRQHKERIAVLFGALEYASRIQARDAIEPALAENRLVFEKYGPDNDYRYDPESELAATWHAKMMATILPNNRKIMAVLQVNRRHLNDGEKLTTARFQQHIADLEARHILDEPSAVAERFPPGVAQIFMDSR